LREKKKNNFFEQKAKKKRGRVVEIVFEGEEG